MINKTINLEIAQLQQNYIHPDSIGKKIQEAKRLLKDVDYELYKLEESLKKENLDVEKLEETTMIALFYKCLGQYEKRVDKEKEEALAARLKYEACKLRQEALTKSISELTEKQYDMAQIQKKIELLREEKRRLIESSNTPENEMIQKLQEEIEELNREIKEIKEAISPGNAAAMELHDALSVLNSAENWGVYDMLGGGLVADMVKHSKIDDAKNHILRAQNHLQRLQIELQDVDMRVDSNINVTQGAVLADFFFDGLIADWYMQSKISQSKENVTKVYGQVSQVVNRLSKELESKEKAIEAKKREIERLVEEA